jgi:hypothetical protein
MMRAGTLGSAVVVAFLLPAGAQSDHDRARSFAGSWAVDSDGNQGRLVFSHVSDAAGRGMIASLGSTLACAEPSDYYAGRFAIPAGGGPLVGCTSTHGATRRLDGVYLSEALAPAGPPMELDVVVRHLAGGPRARASWTTATDPGTVRQAPLEFAAHVAGDGARAEPIVTLRGFRVTGVRAAGGATATIKGTFRGRVVAGRPMYRLLPVGRAVATYRQGTAAAQRARIERVRLDARSGSEYLRIDGAGPLIGGPVTAGSGGVCRRVAFRYTVRPKRRIAVLRWACRRGTDDRSPPVQVDVFRRPRDTIVSSYTIITRPCSPLQPAGRAPRAAQRDC